MKRFKIFSLLLAAVALFTACEEQKTPVGVATYEVVISVSAPAEYTGTVDYSPLVVTAQSTQNAFESAVDATGNATFELPAAQYTFKTNGVLIIDGKPVTVNSTSQTTVDEGWDSASSVVLELTAVEISQLIIKEVYTTGCADVVEVGDSYHFDRMVTIYNNSNYEASLDNVGLATSDPWNAQKANSWLDADGNFTFESEGWIPASHGIWYFQSGHTIAPYSQIVVSLGAAIDHTTTQTNALNLTGADFVTYDPESGYNHASWYKEPYEGISTDRYLKASVYGMGNGWIISGSSPSLMLFQTEGTTPEAFGADVSLETYTPGFEGIQAFAARKLPREWVLDGMEIWSTGYPEESNKRLTNDIDAGYIFCTIGLGASIYRNVDQAATEAIAENEGKLVYNYSLGTEGEEYGTTDPSGIDAEASIAAGAKIVYKDVNDSSVDFHRRSVVSIK